MTGRPLQRMLKGKRMFEYLVEEEEGKIILHVWDQYPPYSKFIQLDLYREVDAPTARRNGRNV